MDDKDKSRMPRCRGLLGLITGHKFHIESGFKFWETDYCTRCGIAHQ